MRIKPLFIYRNRVGRKPKREAGMFYFSPGLVLGSVSLTTHSTSGGNTLTAEKTWIKDSWHFVDPGSLGVGEREGLGVEKYWVRVEKYLSQGSPTPKGGLSRSSWTVLQPKLPSPPPGGLWMKAPGLRIERAFRAWLAREGLGGGQWIWVYISLQKTVMP